MFAVSELVNFSYWKVIYNVKYCFTVHGSLLFFTVHLFFTGNFRIEVQASCSHFFQNFEAESFFIFLECISTEFFMAEVYKQL